MTKVLEPPIETSPKINYSIIKQIIKDRKHPLDMVREAISNMGDQDVGAKNCDIEYYKDTTYGSSFIFRDDGCGMRYSGDENNPEGLDKFADKILFPDKLKEANRILKTVGLPKTAY